MKNNFDIRVLCCASRSGRLMIYKNLFYRISSYNYGSDPGSNFTAPIATGNKESFFEKMRPGEIDSSKYLSQLTHIVPEIYKKLIGSATLGIKSNLDSSFMVWGLDFIPRQSDNRLMFLELNVTPGWYAIYGLKNYQEFYQFVTDFIYGVDPQDKDCIYITL